METLSQVLQHTSPSLELAKPVEKVQYAYLTLESPETVLGTVALPEGPTKSKFRFEFTPMMSGNYVLVLDLLVDEGHIPLSSSRGKVITVTGPDLLDTKSQQRQQQHCGSVLERTDGHWVRCRSKAKPGECLRWGYMFLPTNCHLQNWNHPQLLQHSANASLPHRKIMYIGTSRIRGVFLSAVDHLFGNLAQGLSGIRKCWGTVAAKLGNIELAYQDLRALSYMNFPALTPRTEKLLCHGDHVALSAYEVQHNATEYMRGLFLHREEWPTTIVLDWRGLGEDLVKDFDTYREILSIPEDWQGELVLMNFRSEIGNNLHLPYPQQAAAGIQRALGRPLRVIDLGDLVGPFLRYAEFGAGRPSFHWHHMVNLPLMSVSGIIPDVLAQMVFNIDLGPRPTGLAPKVAPQDMERLYLETKTEVCKDCPAALFPYHIKVQPELKCFDHVPNGEEVDLHLPVAPTPCPEWCMARDPRGFVTTMSGKLPERSCARQSNDRLGYLRG